MLQGLLRAARQTFVRLTHTQMPPRQISAQQTPAGCHQRACRNDCNGKGNIDEKQRGCGTKQADELSRHLRAAGDPPFADGIGVLRQAAEDLPAVIAIVRLRILPQKLFKRVAPQRCRSAIDHSAGKQIKPAIEQWESKRQKQQRPAPRAAALVQHPAAHQSQCRHAKRQRSHACIQQCQRRFIGGHRHFFRRQRRAFRWIHFMFSRVSVPSVSAEADTAASAKGDGRERY